MTIYPTDEQQAAINLFGERQNLAIEAGAGTGKTSCLQMLAESTRRSGLYLAFNKSIVTEAQSRFPSSVACSTAHSLAFRRVGRRYAHRLGSARMRSDLIARHLDLGHMTIRYGQQVKVLQPGYLAGLVMRAIGVFCQTADDGPGTRHIPYVDGIDVPASDGRRTWANNDALRAHLDKALSAAWADLTNVDGVLPYRHDHYLKFFQLSEPKLPADFILFDEAQDASPVMIDVVQRQIDAQVVWVGDSQQQVYSWRGAVNALAGIEAAQRTFLTQSFRFGPEIAEAANAVLEELDADLRLRGTDGIDSTLGAIERPDAVLCRTNAAAVAQVLSYQRRNVPVHLIGGGEDVLRFAKAADDLRTSGYTAHPDLACFTSWDEVKAYCEDDPQGGELKLLVGLVEDFGTQIIRGALERMIPEKAAQVVVSTAHKAKGREWSTVQLHDDFRDPGEREEPNDEEWRLLYVALTRAKHVLDIEGCPPLARLLGLDETEQASLL